MDCIFCAIIRGDAPASEVYRDGRVLAFMDIRPIHPGHVLVVPTEHAAGLEGLDPPLGGELFRVAQKVAAALRRSKLRAEGINLLLSDGAVAGQEVFHAHLHVLPRFAGDGFRFRMGTPEDAPSRSALDEQAQHLAQLLSR